MPLNRLGIGSQHWPRVADLPRESPPCGEAPESFQGPWWGFSSGSLGHGWGGQSLIAWNAWTDSSGVSKSRFAALECCCSSKAAPVMFLVLEQFWGILVFVLQRSSSRTTDRVGGFCVALLPRFRFCWLCAALLPLVACGTSSIGSVCHFLDGFYVSLGPCGTRFAPHATHLQVTP